MEAKKYNAVKKLITYANNGIDDEYVEKINDKEVLKARHGKSSSRHLSNGQYGRCFRSQSSRIWL